MDKTTDVESIAEASQSPAAQDDCTRIRARLPAPHVGKKGGVQVVGHVWLLIETGGGEGGAE